MKNNILRINEYRNNPEFYFSKGLRFANKKNLSEAYRNLTKALELEPDNSEYKFNMACFLSELQRPSEANRLFGDILINFEPTMFDCFFGMGCNSFEVGNNEKAAEYFDKYLYFDAEGEFSYEITEMSFYLKLYSEVSHNNRFLKTSASNFKKAQKYLLESNKEKAVDCLYRSVSANPLDKEARNLLTLVLLEIHQHIRAGYINSTVNLIDDEDVWSTCLGTYLLHRTKKKVSLSNALDMLPYLPVESREELLCIATTLMIFHRNEELVKFMEAYVARHKDQLICSVLLLAYVITGNTDKAVEAARTFKGCFSSEAEIDRWIAYILEPDNFHRISENSIEEYLNLFSLNQEPANYKYDPSLYLRLFETDKRKVRLPKRYMPIIEGTVSKREIMYSRQYRKEIIGLLQGALDRVEQPVELKEAGPEMYSAALEYAYCRLFHIDMEKGELARKYKISVELLNRALKSLDIRQ